MRGKQAKQRKMQPDRRYNSLLVAKLVNYVMVDGKKATARNLVYSAMDQLAEKTKMKPLEALEKAVDMVKPKVEVRSRRVGGANYQVPVPVDEKRQQTLALRWIVGASREARRNTSYADVLFQELHSALNKDGAAFRKKEETHRMADANKAFSHLNW